eukprot:4193909-Pyramimonas_sp.AAC.1
MSPSRTSLSRSPLSVSCDKPVLLLFLVLLIRGPCEEAHYAVPQAQEVPSGLQPLRSRCTEPRDPLLPRVCGPRECPSDPS